jgi:hypothetical protein
VALISNTTVAPLYMDPLLRGLEKVGVDVSRRHLPDGEAYKNWESLNLIYDALLASRCDRAPPSLPSAAASSAIWPALPPPPTSAACLHPDTDHAAIAGRFIGRWQDRESTIRGQEHGRCLLAAEAGVWPTPIR